MALSLLEDCHISIDLKEIQEVKKYDYVVIGSSFTALAFIDEILKRKPVTKILCLERGDLGLLQHFQSASSPLELVSNGIPEIYPWTLSTETALSSELGFCRGACPYFGGKSPYWYGWSPRPSLDQLRRFPLHMLERAADPKFWDRAIELLNVVKVDQCGDQRYGKFQAGLSASLETVTAVVPTAKTSEPASFSVTTTGSTCTAPFTRFSVPGPLTNIIRSQRQKAHLDIATGAPLDLVLNCPVTRLKCDVKGRTVNTIETGGGSLVLPNNKTKIILCAGAIPNATLLLNSFDRASKTVGKCITGHFVTNICCRIPIKACRAWQETDTQKAISKSLGIATHYIAGSSPLNKGQYHVQITAFYSPHPEDEYEEIICRSPNYNQKPTLLQLRGSEDYVLLCCASLGELNETNENSWLRLNKPCSNDTRDVELQYTLTDIDRSLWDTMDEATFQILYTLCENEDVIEFWDSKDSAWVEHRPHKNERRCRDVVHESGLARVGDEGQGGSLDALYRPYGCDNVFLTGGAIFPTAGSWNPTLTMCAFAQELARVLSEM